MGYILGISWDILGYLGIMFFHVFPFFPDFSGALGESNVANGMLESTIIRWIQLAAQIAGR